MGVNEETELLFDVKIILEEAVGRKFVVGDTGDENESPILLMYYKERIYAIAVVEFSVQPEDF